MGYNPSELRDESGKWTTGGRAISSKVAKAVEKEAADNLHNDVSALMIRAKEAGEEVDNTAREAARRVGGYTTPINYKSYDSISRKAKIEYNGDVSQVKDAVRTTIIVNNEEDVQTVLKMFDKPGNRIKIQKPEDFLGYSGSIINFKAANGLNCEIQVNTPEMIYAKDTFAESIIGTKKFNEIKNRTGEKHGLGHTYYEDFRILDKFKPESIPYMQEVERQSKNYYNKFR